MYNYLGISHLDQKFSTPIIMGKLSLKNSITGICMLLLVQCKTVKDQNWVFSTEFPPIVIMNARETEIKQTPIYLKRNNVTIDTGRLDLYSTSGNKIDVQIHLNKKDSLYNNDKIVFNLKGQEYTISDFQKNKVKSSGVPYIISYKINEIPFVEREGYIDTK
ncbi:hypothetical protein [Pedobacter caeni]|uniref:Uncharacterized protein n=1 Tax=Pedobacter caeni TaxID=288992 RepID=A0A1M4Z6P0_9SPHI|nr:hypothetical protein [Pedobacter caeni]SHF13276.1 hypothetical protein SAMN04488522_102195 [Pedobacter caeni]